MTTATEICDQLGFTPREAKRSQGRVAAMKAVNGAVERYFQFPTTATLGDTKVHLFQTVHEHVSNPLADDEIVEWTVCSLADETVMLRDAGSWNREAELSYQEFEDEIIEGTYTPVYLADGSPRWGY